MSKACDDNGIKFYHPSPILCTDNAAMIGAAAYYEYKAGVRSSWDLNAVPNLKLGENNENIAIVLAGGNGSRMNSNIPKQYMEIAGKTILHYSLQQFEECPFIDEIILVTRKEDVDYCKDTYRMSKISHIVEGGKERYESVMNGLDLVEDEGYVYIHDGARPCITEELLDRLYNDVKLHRATVLAVRSKDTVRISDDKGNAVITPNRDNVWLIQTPQVFDISLIKQAYYNLKKYGTGKI